MAAKSRGYRPRRYAVPAYIKEALNYLRPPEEISVSEWAEKYRVLDAKTSAAPGPWRNEKTPYLVGIMDEFKSYETEEIVFVKPTQVGGTEAMQNMIGYVIQQDPSPALVVYPSDPLAESFSENRLKPMLRASPTLKERWKETISSRTEMQFEGMYLSLVGSNSPANLSSKPIRFLFLDEIDKYPGASRKEADPISLAEERTKTFHNRKIFKTSTPTLKSGHIWKAMSWFGTDWDTVWSNVKSFFQNSQIKGLFNFSWSLPHIKTPHFYISSYLTVLGVKIPSIGVSWYKNGGILDGAQIFGKMGDKLLGGGEAGKEAVLPLSELWKNMRSIMTELLEKNTAQGSSSIAQAINVLTERMADRESARGITPLREILAGLFQQNQPALAGGPSSSWQISFSPVYNFNGEAAPTKEEIVEANRISEEEFEYRMEEWLRNHDRRDF